MLIEPVLLGLDVLCRDGQKLIITQRNCKMEQVNAIQPSASIPTAETDKLNKILESYKSLFSTDIKDLGNCSIMKMDIELKTDVPVCLKPRRLPFPKRRIVNEIITELLTHGIIRRSHSPYASPIVLVDKKNGEHRLCIDYRCLNQITVKMPFPMPVMEEQFAQLAGNGFFSTLDLKMGYYQIELTERSKKFTAFVTTDGHFEFNRMPFGLVNAAAVFQTLMNLLMSKMGNGEVMSYLDDVIIPSHTVEEGLSRLDKFLSILKQNGLTLRLSKCQFLVTKIHHLGYIVTEAGISPGDKKMSAIENFPVPLNTTEVRRFLGLSGFFRKFVLNYALKAKPLTMLLCKNQKFMWGIEQQTAFQNLINDLTSAPILDASAIGLAGVLLQSKDGSAWQPVSYYSRHCTQAESKYHSYELEVLAVVNVLERFRVYLLGKQFRLVADCSAITTIKSQKELKSKIARWWMRLLEFDFIAIHRPGTKLAHVDALSRAPDEPPNETEMAGLVLNIKEITDDWLLTMQLQDAKLRQIINVLNGTEKSRQDKQISTDYVLNNHRLYRKVSNNTYFVVPKAVRWRVVQFCHDNMGHFGLDKTIERVQQTFWFTRMRKYIKEYIAACVNCCMNKARGGKPEGEMHIYSSEPLPFATVHMDHLGPFIKSKRGNTHIVAISDAFTKFLIVKAVKSTKTTPVINVMNELTGYFGLPKQIISDRGTAYTSKAFEEYCATNNIQHIKYAVRTPRANGQVERANRIILDYLRTTTEITKDWDLHLRELQWTVNSQKNSTTGFTPNELIFDFKLRDVTQNQLMAALHDEPTENENVNIKEKRQQAITNINQEREKWKSRFDKKHAKPTMYHEDDLVVIQNEPAATGESRKLEPKFKGPYIVTKVLGNDRYLIENMPGSHNTNRKFCSVYTVDKMKPWCTVSPDIDLTISDDDSEEDE